MNFLVGFLDHEVKENYKSVWILQSSSGLARNFQLIILIEILPKYQIF